MTDNTDTAQEDFIFRSDFYEIKFWNYSGINEPVTGWTEAFCVSYVYSGHFLFDLFRSNYDLRSGWILLDKPRCDYRVLPAIGQSTIFRFSQPFYSWMFDIARFRKTYFLSNENLLSLSMKGNPAIDYLHHQIFQNRFTLPKLEMDILVMELLSQVIDIVDRGLLAVDGNSSNEDHFSKVELAKEYMNTHLSENISLQDIAAYACISPFHFSRLFKKFTSFAPYQYLQNIRLTQGKLLLKNTNLSVSEISRRSGFRTPEYFASSFRQMFDEKPSHYRKLSQR